MRDLRRDACGACWTERCDSLEGLRARGTVTSLPYIVAGPRGGRAILFDGTDDKWACAVNRSINTFEAWVYFTLTTEEVCDFDGGTHKLKATTGTLAATGWGTPTIYVDGAATTTVTTGWHHIAVTSATAFTCTTLQLGTDNTGFGAVRFADVSLWPRALSSAEVLGEYNGTTFRYDDYLVTDLDMSTINPRDRRGTNNGTGTGLVASTDIVAGPYCGQRAIEFNGTDEYVGCASSATFDFGTSDFSISVLFRVNTLPAGGTTAGLVARELAGDAIALYVGINGDNKKPAAYFRAASTNYVNGVLDATALTAGPLYHIVYSFDRDGNAYAVIDGRIGTTPISMSAGAAASFTSTRKLVVGARSDGTSANFNGVIVDVRIYSGLALTAIQSMDLANRLKSGRA